MQSIRIAVGDNRKMKLLATRLGVSFNSWAVETLLAEVERQTTQKGVSDGGVSEVGAAAEAGA